MGKARGRPGIGLHDVARACIALQKQRRAFGTSNLRLELGKGSYSTLVKYRRRLALIDPNAKNDARVPATMKSRGMKR